MNLGALTLASLLEERDKNGFYQSYDEFISRTKDILNKRVVESMIYAGALDCFQIPRKQMVLEYDTSLELANYGAILKVNCRSMSLKKKNIVLKKSLV